MTFLLILSGGKYVFGDQGIRLVKNNIAIDMQMYCCVRWIINITLKKAFKIKRLIIIYKIVHKTCVFFSKKDGLNQISQ